MFYRLTSKENFITGHLDFFGKFAVFLIKHFIANTAVALALLDYE